MDASRTTHQLEEMLNAFQKQKLKDLQVGVEALCWRDWRCLVCACTCVSLVRLCLHVYA